jgi:GTP-binding protein SAR1
MKLEFLGLLKKKARVLFLGLDNAGKTTLLGRLKDNRMTTNPPTTHPTSEELHLGNLHVTTFDLGGHVQVRKIWNSYFPIADGIIFMVDASRPDRLAEAQVELQSLLKSTQLTNIPFLILGNKIDVDGAVSESVMAEKLELNLLRTGKSTSKSLNKGTRRIEIYMCTVLCGQGYGEGLLWLTQNI